MLVLSKAALALLVRVAAARAVPLRLTTPQEPQLHGAVSSAQATFQVPCHGCLGGVDDDALLFDFETLPASQPCGESNLRLNGRDIVTGGQSIYANGSDVLPALNDARQQGIKLNWEISCLSDNSSSNSSPTDDSALVLTVTVSKLGDLAPQSLSGFTVSFKQYPKSEILRLDLSPVSPVPKSPAEEWRDPPSDLRLDSLFPGRLDPTRILDQRLRELEALRAQKKELKRLIEAKEQQLKTELEGRGQDFQYDLKDCDSLDCAFQAVSQRVKSAFKAFYSRLTSQGWGQTTLSGDNSATHLEDDMHLQPPPPVHFRPDDVSEVSSYGSYEKLPDEEPQPRPFGQDKARRRSPLIAVLHFILVVFGLIALAAFIRRRCASLRTRTERAANREERRNRRAYRRAARRAAWKNWWRSGWGRRKDQERRLDYEEKRTLIQQQESRLEGAMQDEIQNLRHAHGVVDQLVRAEEGRGTLAQPVIIRGRMPGMASIAGIMMGQDVYSSSHLSGSTAVSETDDGSTVLTPPTSATAFSGTMSRSNSLPSYRTDPTHPSSAPSSRFGDSDVDNRSIFSDPPAYQTDPEDSDDESHAGSMGANIVTDGFTRYTPSEYAPSLLSPTDTASIFTPDSSIPDLSPRESAETVRTFM